MQNNTTFLEECGSCPVLASYTLAFVLQPRKKHGKTLVRVPSPMRIIHVLETLHTSYVKCHTRHKMVQIISTVKFRMIRVGHFTWLGQIRSTEFRSESPKEGDNLRDLAADGRITDNNWTQMVCEVRAGSVYVRMQKKWYRVLKNIRDLQVPS